MKPTPEKCEKLMKGISKRTDEISTEKELLKLKRDQHKIIKLRIR